MAAHRVGKDSTFVAFAALTMGMLELALGRDDAARDYLIEVDELGGKFGNNWLKASARTQLATLAVRDNQLGEARARLVDSLDAIEDSPLNTLTVTFALVAFAQLALAGGETPLAAMALGAADGLRKRAGLRAWPLTRRIEAELITRVTQQTDPAGYDEAFAAGAELHARDALGLVRAHVALETDTSP